MRDTGHSHYLEAGVLLAGPLQLIQLLYQGARENVQLARRYLAEGDVLARSRPVSKATEILGELILSLNPAAVETAPRLAELYRYLQDLILEAHARQADGPLEEAEKLLSELAENWKGVSALLEQSPNPSQFVAPPSQSRDVLPTYDHEARPGAVDAGSGSLRRSWSA